MTKSLRLFAGIHIIGLGALLSRAFAHGDSTEVAAKWYNRLSQSTDDMRAGVQRVQQAPGQAAAQKRQKWVNALMDTNTQDKWARNVASVSLADWQNSMLNYGINRVAQGAQAKQEKFAQRLAPLLQHIDTVAAQVRSMPDLTPADRENRAIAMMRGMRKYQRPGA